MTIKKLKMFLDQATIMLQESIKSHVTFDTIEGRVELERLVGQLQALNYLKEIIK